MARRIEDEVVEDSEPEREELRRTLRKARTHAGAPGKPPHPAHDVIELTDDDSDVGGKRSLGTVLLPSTIDDASESIGSPISPSTGQATFLSCRNAKGIVPVSILSLPQDSVKHTPVVRALLHGTHPCQSPPRDLGVPCISNTNNEAIHDESYGISADSELPINLARFAYANTRPSANPTDRFVSTSRQSSVLSNGNGEVKVSSKKKLAQKPSHRFASDFSDADLTLLMKCVSCDVRWTTRKSTAQKMRHIESCAKKKAFSDSTLRVLIRKELDAAANEDAIGLGKSKSSVVEPGKTSALKTHFEDVVDKAAPKRKIRHPEAAETIQDIAITRNHILGRARAVLGLEHTHSMSKFNDGEYSVHTQAFGQSDLGNQGNIYPETQAFGRSNLGQSHASGPSSAGAAILNDKPHASKNTYVEVLMPSTQCFAPSKLGGLVLNQQPTHESPRPEAQHVISSSLRIEPCSPAPLDFDISNRPIDISSKNSVVECSCNLSRNLSAFDLEIDSGKECCPQSMIATKNKEYIGPSASIIQTTTGFWRDGFDVSSDTYDMPLDKMAWQNDDAFLHFEPERDDSENVETALFVGPNISHRSSLTISAKTLKIKKSIKAKAPLDVISSSPLMKTVTPRKRAAKDKGKQGESVDGHEFDKAWEQQMKDKILQDTDLYLRVLRYEPVPIEVFLKLVSDGPLYSGKTKAKLRSFLDNQAINFYGGESWKK